MAESSKASVVIPSFNHEAYVEQAVCSVLGQGYPDVELIVVDDASADRTPEILQRLANEHGFTFVRNERNCGLNPTLERGIGLSTGKFVSILASDDMILPHKLERQVAYLQSTGKDGVYANGRYLHADGSTAPIDLGEVARRFAAGTMLPYVYTQDTQAPLLQSALIRREPLLAMCEVRAQFRSDDWVTLIKLLEGYDIGFIDEPLFLYRQHDVNTHRDYRATFPMRIDVIGRAVPARYRRQAMANLLSSQASYLRKDGRIGEALRLGLKSARMHPSPARLARYVRSRARAAARKARRLLKR